MLELVGGTELAIDEVIDAVARIWEELNHARTVLDNWDQDLRPSEFDAEASLEIARIEQAIRHGDIWLLSASARTRASRLSSFASAGREAVAETVELLWVESVDREPPVHEALDDRPVRDFDRHRNVRGGSSGSGGDPIGHLGQPRTPDLTP